MEYKIELTEIPFQRIPKKINLRQRIGISTEYEIYIGIWIPDTPYSKLPPKYVMYFFHGKIGKNKQYIRFIFDSIEDIEAFLDYLKNLFESWKDSLEKAMNIALQEWEEMHIRQKEIKKKDE